MSHCHTILSQLRQRGYRITPQRELIIEALEHTPGHITVEDLHGRVQEKTSAINIATIYRTLDMLVAEGLASRAGPTSGPLSYAPSLHGAHLHLVCRHCQQSLDADHNLMAATSQHLYDLYGFAVDQNHLTLPGVCRACQAAHVERLEEE